MTDRWAAKRGHNLIFFTSKRGVQANPFLFLFQGFVCKKYFIKQTFKLQFCCSVSPGSVYSCTVILRSQVLPLNVYLIAHLDPGGRKKHPSRFFFWRAVGTHFWNGASLTQYSITATTYDSLSHTHTQTYPHTHIFAGWWTSAQADKRRWNDLYNIAVLFGNLH